MPEKAALRPDDALRLLQASAKQSDVRRRVDVFVHAAEEALLKNDIVAASNNYRLALQNAEDVTIRQKLDTIEARAKDIHYEQSVTRARAAEQAKRWGEAATYYGKAHAARPEAALAERAAYAAGQSGENLHRAAELGQQAVTAEPQNAAYRMTLAEVYLAAKLYLRAAREAARALELEPNNVRAKELVAALPKKNER